ncbi:MAG: lipid-A-disaccharide synthase [candidate division WOR-3 bacterium]
MEKKFLIIAGEESGDKNASRLINKLKKIDKDIKIYAFAGKHSEKEGAYLIKNITHHGEVGFVEIFDKFSYYYNLRKEILKFIERENIKNIILVDFPGFNLHMAKILKEKGKRVFYYVIPQIWAWGNWRWKYLYKYVDFSLCIFPFEEEILRKNGVNAFYVGNPLIEENERIEYLPKKIFSFLPGSRKSEIKVLLPVYEKIADKLKKIYPSHSFKISLLKDFKFNKEKFEVHKGDARDILKISEGAFIASGTATLEAALIGIPFLIFYKVSNITYFLAKLFVKVKYAGIPNILLKNEEIKEYIQNINIDKAVEDFKKIIEEKEKFIRIKNELINLFKEKRACAPEKIIIENSL